jgi:hypothetical protein
MQKRSIRHRLNKRAVTFYVYKWLYACGIRDVNVMNSIVDEYIDKYSGARGEGSFYRKDFYSLTQFILGVCFERSATKFLKWAMRGRTPESIKSFIMGFDSTYLLCDGARMFKELEGVLPVDFDRSGSVKDIHDRLSALLAQHRFGNRVIKYTPIELQLAGNCGDFTFELPKDTDSLYEIGKALRICVGSYGADAFHKRCIIVTMNKDDKYVACIELRKKKNGLQMYQLKGKFNHTVTEVGPVTEWALANNINLDCYDYQHAINHETNQFDGRNVDYHVVNPRLNDEDDTDLDEAFYGAPANPFDEFLPF